MSNNNDDDAASSTRHADSRRDFLGERVAGVSVGGSMGTLKGVYLPCLQNIWGVLLFIRLPWITGQAGIIVSCLVVLLCVSTSIPTALSMTAIATNGRIPAGGPYYVISRSLGASFGGAIGFLFFLGTALAATMYILGAVETFQDGFDLDEFFAMDREVIAICLIVVLATIIYVGMEWVNRVAGLFLAVVLISIVLALGGLAAFGAGASFGSTDEVERADGAAWGTAFVEDPDTGITPDFARVLSIFYPAVTGIMAGSNRSALLKDPATAIPFGTLGAIATTTTLYIITIFLFGNFVDRSTLLDNKIVMAAVAWPFKEVVTVGILMSSIGAGLQSLTGAPQLFAAMLTDEVLPFGDFAKSIGAWFATTCPSLCGCCKKQDAASLAAEEVSMKRARSESFAASAEDGLEEGLDNVVLRSESSRRKTTAAMRTPAPSKRNVMDEEELRRARQASFSSMVSAEGAAVQEEHRARRSSAERDAEAGGEVEMTAVPSDGEKHAWNRDYDNDDDDDDDDKGQGESRAEPVAVVAGFREIYLTCFLAAVPCLAGNLDQITPIQTMFFLMMYATINLAALLYGLFPSAGFRPRRKVHWTVHLFGTISCIVVMMIVQWWQALIAMAIAGGLYYWISQGEQEEAWGSWGSSMDNMRLGRAHQILLDMRNLNFSPNNWRPQIMAMLETDDEGRPHRPELLLLIAQMKRGHGLTIGVTVKEGRLLSMLNREFERQHAAERGTTVGTLANPVPFHEVETVLGRPKQTLQNAMDVSGVEGFSQVMVSDRGFDGLTAALQCVGLGPLKPNSVSVGWPRHWRYDDERMEQFVVFLKTALRMRQSLIVYKCDFDTAVASLEEKPLTGTIDIWWMMKDSGLLLLLPFLLTHHPVWSQCRLRLFAVSSSTSIRKEDLELYLKAVCIPAEVHLINVAQTVVDEAMNGRTMTPADRERLLAGVSAQGGAAGASSMTMAAQRSQEPERRTVMDAFPRPESDQEADTGSGEEKASDQPQEASVAAENVDVGVGESNPADEASSSNPSDPRSRFVQSAEEMNAHIQQHSGGAALVVTNLALTRRVDAREFMEYTETFTRGIPRVLLLRGTGQEIMTIYA